MAVIRRRSTTNAEQQESYERFITDFGERFNAFEDFYGVEHLERLVSGQASVCSTPIVNV